MDSPTSSATRVVCHATIFLAGGRATHWARVVTGSVGECEISLDGNRRLTGFRLPGEAFGVEIGRYSRTSEALVDSAIELHATNDPQTDSQLFAAMAWQLQRVRSDQLITMLRSVPERISALLLDLSDRGFGDCFRFPMSRNDIADFLGTTEPTISRTLNSLELRGAIRRVAHGAIQITDRSQLAQLAHTVERQPKARSHA